MDKCDVCRADAPHYEETDGLGYWHFRCYEHSTVRVSRKELDELRTFKASAFLDTRQVLPVKAHGGECDCAFFMNVGETHTCPHGITRTLSLDGSKVAVTSPITEVVAGGKDGDRD